MLCKVSVVGCIYPLCPRWFLPIEWHSIEWIHPLGSDDPTYSRWKTCTFELFIFRNYVYKYLVQLSLKSLCFSIGLTAITFLPFVHLNYAAHRAFCTDPVKAPWCSKFAPSIYAHVQSTYWNVGLLRYWTLQQLPNFIISAPPLLSLFYYSFHYFKSSFIPGICSKLTNRLKTPLTSSLSSSPFLSTSLAPHVIHACFFTLTLLFTSHTQIILRLSPSMPIFYWAASWLLVEHPCIGRWWFGWSLNWSVVSVILWASFLPPA